LLDLARESELPFAVAYRLLRPPALEELTDLAADGSHHLDEFIVRAQHLPAEKLHDAEKLDPVIDGEAIGPVQPLSGCNRRSGEVGILGHVGNPVGTLAAPNAARQPDAHGAATFPAGSRKRGRLDCRGVPDIDTA
jgi:hypothetical protein